MKLMHAMFVMGASLAFAPPPALAQPPQPTPLPLVSPIFGDNMVLQRAKANTIWGWSQPGDTVRVDLGENSATGTAGTDGKWQVRIQPPAPGGPYSLKITGRQTAELRNVMVGDVWIAAGQSNMQFGLGQARNAPDEIKNANHPQIRFFVVGQRGSYKHADIPSGSWKVVSPETVGGRGGISAVAYFFARRIQRDLRIPIGLVQVAVGGVPAETLTSPEALRPLLDFNAGLDEVERHAKNGAPEHGNYISHWYDDYDIALKNGQNWADPQWDSLGWKPVLVPGTFHELGIADTPSLTWFRKEFTLPDPVPPGPTRVYLGQVEKMDTTFVNGRQIGASSWVENPRVYGVPDGVLRPGRNVIAIRLFKVKPGGGFLGKPAELRLALGDGSSIPLSGEWKGKVSVDARPPHPLPIRLENSPSMPSILYNGMLAPIAPMAITGALWYQGESNAERAFGYRKLLPALITDWRKLFGQGDFPFYIAGLPFYKNRSSVPKEDSWAELREVQASVVGAMPRTCLAVTIDTGNAEDVHPIDKVEVGDRLGLCALGEHYGKPIPYRGPTLAAVEPIPGGLRVRFKHADGGLVVKGDRLAEFSIAGEDRKWYWAEARVDGNTVVVSSPSVPNPIAVRYAWQANPEATLFNGAGLPAVPFRTDDWPGITEGRP